MDKALAGLLEVAGSGEEVKLCRVVELLMEAGRSASLTRMAAGGRSIPLAEVKARLGL